jgi:hypothetical protein
VGIRICQTVGHPGKCSRALGNAATLAIEAVMATLFKRAMTACISNGSTTELRDQRNSVGHLAANTGTDFVLNLQVSRRFLSRQNSRQ